MKCDQHGQGDQLIARYIAKLKSDRKREYIIDGHFVGKAFFNELHSPNCLLTPTHVDALLSLVWRRHVDSLLINRVGILETWWKKQGRLKIGHGAVVLGTMSRELYQDVSTRWPGLLMLTPFRLQSTWGMITGLQLA